MKRKNISKKLRFEIFKRDSFTCQYCGSNPPKVVLEIDHIHPVKEGGNNSEENLLTACFDCNRGKGAGLLKHKTMSNTEKIKILKEKESQFNEYIKLVKKISGNNRKLSVEVENVYSNYYPKFMFSESFHRSVLNFIENLGAEAVIECMHKAFTKTNNENDILKYFCGICWNKIKWNKNEWI